MNKLIILIIFLSSLNFAVAQSTVGENLKIAAELLEQKEYESSLLFCNKALDIDPNLPNAYFFRGLNNHGLENYQDAIIDFTVTVKLQPDFIDGYYQRAKSKQANNDFLGAAKDFNMARELSPSQTTLFLVKGVLSSLFGGSDKKKKKGK